MMWKVKDLAGSKVVDENGLEIGILMDVLPSGSNDIWVVSCDAVKKKELLIPALKDIIKEVDAAGKRIVVSLPSGLKEIFDEN